MTFDLVLGQGTVVDGSGSPPFVADVGISGDHITGIGDLREAVSGERVDCSGLVVAPGFIDVHTHYDAQILWDPSLTPSRWYGVTTVLMGNCGLTIAPTRPDARETCVGTLESVEAMSASVLNSGVDWDFETFSDYLARLRREPMTLNVGAMVGHSMLRMFVLGEEAFTRASATSAELRQMSDHLERALSDGAFGFSCSKQPSHVDGKGRPIPGRVADLDEFVALADVLKANRRGLLQANRGPGFGVAEIGSIAESIGRPVTWTALRSTPNTVEARAMLAESEVFQQRGVRLWPQMTCVPTVLDFNLEKPYMLLESLPSFARLAGLDRDSRMAAMNDPAFRTEAQNDIERDYVGRRIVLDWHRIFVLKSSSSPECEDRSIADLSASFGKRPIDVMFDLALSESLETHFGFLGSDYDEEILAEFLRSPVAILGLSDAGAHASQLCGAAYGSQLLGHWVRERKEFPIEFAIWRLTGHVADACGLSDRGRIQQGLMADLCVFDATTINQGPARRVFDQPAGGDRIVRDVDGIVHVMVNGRFIVRDGSSIDASPGRLLDAPL